MDTSLRVGDIVLVGKKYIAYINCSGKDGYIEISIWLVGKVKKLG